MRHKAAFVVFVVGVLLFGARASAEDTEMAALGLTANLQIAQDRFTRFGEIPVTFSLTNTTNAIIRVPRRMTPLRGIDNNIFIVTRDGEKVPYTGRFMHPLEPTDADYIAIKPGQTVSATFDLSSVYDMSVTGDYTVRYRVPMSLYRDVPSRLPRDAEPNVMGIITSNQVSLFAEGRGEPEFAGDTEMAALGLTANLQIAQDRFTIFEEIPVTFSLTNTTKAIIRVPRWKTPLRGIDNNIFIVTRDGEKVPYTGRFMHPLEPTDTDYIAIKPGKTVSATFDLSSVYDMSVTGDYTVRYRVPMSLYREVPSRLPRDAEPDVMGIITSNQVFLFAEGRGEPEEEGEPTTQLRHAEPPTCSSTQTRVLQTARQNALKLSINALGDLSGNRWGSTNYVTWFGLYNLRRFSLVNSSFLKIRWTIEGEPLTFDCSCTDRGTTAYVDASKPYKIYLCKLFWSRPAWGHSSQAGTLVHEVSHFNIVASTLDYYNGETEAKKWAKKAPDLVVENADSYEFFAENVNSCNPMNGCPLDNWIIEDIPWTGGFLLAPLSDTL